MKAFGIGCLHFTFVGGAKREITVQEYVDEVKASLERLSNVSNVDIKFNEEFKDVKLDISEGCHMNKGDPCYPSIEFFKLTFDLYLPLRVQAEVTNTEEQYIHTDSENFRVLFRHDWHGPLTVIDLVDAGETSSPSNAIQIIREYLKREIGSASDILRLDCVGPSPFHADMFLSEGGSEASDESSKFELLHTKLPGYDRLEFSYNRNQYGSDDVAFRHLISEFSSEVAFYYEVKILDSRRICDWHSVQESLHELLEMEEENYTKTLADRYSNRPKLLNSLYRDIGLFKGQEIYLRNICEQHYFSMYKTEKHNVYFKEFVDAELENRTNYPVKETSEIVEHFQSKSSKSIELIVVLLAAVSGGTVGAAITVLFGS